MLLFLLIFLFLFFLNNIKLIFVILVLDLLFNIRSIFLLNTFKLIDLFLTFGNVAFFFIIDKWRQMGRQNFSRCVISHGQQHLVIQTITHPLGLYVFFIFKFLNMLRVSISDDMSSFFDFIHNRTAHRLDDELHRMSRTLAGNEESESLEKNVGLVVFILKLLRNLVTFAVDQFFFIINLFRNQTA